MITISEWHSLNWAHLGYDQVATDALVSMEKAMKRDNIEVNDRQLACARIQSKEVLDICSNWKRTIFTK